MLYQLSERVQSIKPSATLSVTARAMELQAQGKPIISLSAGEPDFDTPQHIKFAAIEAIIRGFTKYTAVDGIPELKTAIVNKLKKENNLSYEADQIIVSTGAKQGIFNLIQAILNPGDEAIIPAPYWVSYPDMVKLANAKPIILDTHITNNFKITARQVEEAITKNTKLFIINSPSNPSGVAYRKAELANIAQVLLQHPQITILTDDIYEYIWWEREPFSNILNACPELYDRTIVLNGVSKAYAMTGWRIGYSAGPVPLIKAMKKIQSQSTSNPNSIAQKAASAAISGEQNSILEMVKAYKTRHDSVYQRLANMDGIEVKPAAGTFYIFPNIKQIIDRMPAINNDIEFAERLLNETGVALVPGTAFGCPDYIRISYATSLDRLEEALNRFEQFLLD